MEAALKWIQLLGMQQNENSWPKLKTENGIYMHCLRNWRIGHFCWTNPCWLWLLIAFGASLLIITVVLNLNKYNLDVFKTLDLGDPWQSSHRYLTLSSEMIWGHMFTLLAAFTAFQQKVTKQAPLRYLLFAAPGLYAVLCILYGPRQMAVAEVTSRVGLYDHLCWSTQPHHSLSRLANEVKCC